MNGDKRLEGKVIVVSGGTKGVGKAAAEEFICQGAAVVFGGRDDSAAEEILDSVNDSHKIYEGIPKDIPIFSGLNVRNFRQNQYNYI